MSAGFGSLPSLADLPPADLADLLARIQGQQTAAQAQPGSPQQLLFNRDSMGGGANPFVPQAQADPTTTGSTPQPQMVPLPPQRPSDADLAAAPPAPRVFGMNPDARPGMPGVPAQPSVTAASTGNPDASNLTLVNAFDPLTGQPVSGNPKPMQAPGQGGPTEGAGRVAAAAGNPASAGQGGNFLQKFAQGLNNPAIGDLLLNVGIGLMSNRGFGPGIAAGLQGYQANQGNQTKQALQQYQLLQQIQGQNAIRSALKAKGVAPEMIEAAALNPTVLSNVFSQLNQKTPEQIRAEAMASAQGSMLGGEKPLDRVQAEAQASAAGSAAGNQQPLDRIQAEAQARAAGTAAGSPDKPKIVKYKDEQGAERFLQQDPETGDLSVPKGAPDTGGAGSNPYATGKFNSDQAKAAGFSDRMFGAEPVLRQFESLNSGNALGATVAGMAPNAMKSSERQQMDQAQRNFINAQLRRESGAAISQGEFDNARAQYFPQPGDGPEVIAQKRQNRRDAIEAMAREGGNSYRPKSVFDESGNLVPFGQSSAPKAATPAQPSRAQLEAEARRRGLLK